MSAAKSPKSATDKAFADLLAGSTPEVRDLAQKTRALVRKLIPDAEEEVDTPARMLVETYIPGTYKGAILGIAPQKGYVNIMFPKGVEMMPLDARGVWIDEYANLARPDRTNAGPDSGRPAAAAAEGLVPPRPLPRFYATWPESPNAL